MFGHLSGTALVVVDVLRWISIIWTFIAMSWLIQVAVITKSPAVTYLISGFALSLFIDIADEYERLHIDYISYRLPVCYGELVAITIGVYLYQKTHPELDWKPSLFFFLRYRERRKRKQENP